MTNPTIAAPAGFAPQMTVSFASSGDAQSVDSDHPLPIGERAYSGAAPIVPGTDQPVGRGVAITCTASGVLTFKLADQSLLSVPIEPGFMILPLAAVTVVPGSTTATASCANLA